MPYAREREAASPFHSCRRLLVHCFVPFTRTRPSRMAYVARSSCSIARHGTRHTHSSHTHCKHAPPHTRSLTHARKHDRPTRADDSFSFITNSSTHKNIIFPLRLCQMSTAKLVPETYFRANFTQGWRPGCNLLPHGVVFVAPRTTWGDMRPKTWKYMPPVIQRTRSQRLWGLFCGPREALNLHYSTPGRRVSPTLHLVHFPRRS